MKMRLATPALVLVGVLAFAACGGDDDGGGNVLGRSATTAERSGTAAGSDTTAKAASDTTASDDTDTTASDDSSDDTDSSVTVDTNVSGKGSGDFCNYIKDVENDVNLDSLGDAEASPSDVKKQFEQGRDAIDKAADKAPAEIKPDVEKLGDFIHKFGDLLAGYDYDFTKLLTDAQAHPEKLAEFEQLTSDADFQAASERLDAYVSNVCGIDTDSTGG
jgi:hypothetical protein